MNCPRPCRICRGRGYIPRGFLQAHTNADIGSDPCPRCGGSEEEGRKA